MAVKQEKSNNQKYNQVIWVFFLLSVYRERFLPDIAR